MSGQTFETHNQDDAVQMTSPEPDVPATDEIIPPPVPTPDAPEDDEDGVEHEGAPVAALTGVDDDVTAPSTEGDATQVLPILPLRGTVVFPLTVVPLAAAQARSLRLIDEVMSGDRTVGLVMQKDAEQEGAGPDGVLLCPERDAHARVPARSRGRELAQKKKKTNKQSKK